MYVHSIGYHFESKAGLLNAAIGEVFEEWTDKLAAIAMADPGATPVERGRRAWTAMLDSLPATRNLLAVASFVIAICDGVSVQWLLDPEGAPTSAEPSEGCRPWGGIPAGTTVTRPPVHSVVDSVVTPGRAASSAEDSLATVVCGRRGAVTRSTVARSVGSYVEGGAARPV